MKIFPLSILFITPFMQHACAVYYKERSPIDLDIAYELPPQICVSISETHPNGRYFYLKKSIANRFRLGLITCADSVIFLGNEKDMLRFVFLQELDDGKRYMRIVSKLADYHGNARRRVDEFVKLPTVTRFLRLFRTLLYMDIPTQEPNHMIQVETDIQSGALKFSIRPEMKLEVTIGVVKFGRYMVNWRTHGLMERDVIWEGGVDNPHIKMTSLFNDGTRVETTYGFDGRGFIMGSRSQISIFLDPCDEEIRQDLPPKPKRKRRKAEKSNTTYSTSEPTPKSRKKASVGNYQRGSTETSTSAYQGESDSTTADSLSLDLSEDESFKPSISDESQNEQSAAEDAQIISETTSEGPGTSAMVIEHIPLKSDSNLGNNVLPQVENTRLEYSEMEMTNVPKNVDDEKIGDEQAGNMSEEDN
ncbi:hypothetical protein BEWA_035200 [Theileria equi strain WA]|uniref:Signal peptide-containing protein n=1 Tax=Theileria equi strain WA TaxID=1537102 RepID=L1LDX7_THEEQ|nr:hypothetical protein BEWA_035200 [Theileria equi strain WA]EKX73484.1 hypothetical protein BEWA_035200 [Theileria equi strain WA]|eukprot:XP_004832936.1 hypothetical protein BEWA_035200 [Theileria equi strain WA]